MIPLNAAPTAYHRKIIGFVRDMAENTLIHAEHKFILVVSNRDELKTLKEELEETLPKPPIPVIFWDVPTLRNDRIGGLLAGIVFDDQDITSYSFEQALKIYEGMRRRLMKGAIRKVFTSKNIVLGSREQEGADETPEHKEMKYVIAYLISEGVHLERDDRSKDEEKAKIKEVIIEGEVEGPDGQVFADVKAEIDGIGTFYYEYETLFDGGILNVLRTLEKYRGKESQIRIILHPLDAYLHRRWIRILKDRFNGAKFGTIVVKVTRKKKTVHMIPVEEFWKLFKESKASKQESAEKQTGSI